MYEGLILQHLSTCLPIRKALPLNENEGIYIRDIQTGQVRSVMGPQAYMLQANEELYEKELMPLVEDILKWVGGAGG